MFNFIYLTHAYTCEINHQNQESEHIHFMIQSFLMPLCDPLLFSSEHSFPTKSGNHRSMGYFSFSRMLYTIYTIFVCFFKTQHNCFKIHLCHLYDLLGKKI